jgi:hypothetical protein
MTAIGCLTGTSDRQYGQQVIDAHLEQAMGFAVAGAGACLTPIADLGVVLVAVAAVVALPAWTASRISPGLAVAED